MANRITIDPITRIEGHLRVDVEVENGSVSNSWASCTMWRGIENILQGPRPSRCLALHPALLRRVHHGACHGKRPFRGRRSEAGNSAQRPVHPQPHPDCARVARPHRALLSTIGAGLRRHSEDSQPPSTKTTSSPRADSTGRAIPAKTFKAAQDKVNAVAASGQLGIFMNGYWGHPAMRSLPKSTCWPLPTTCRHSNISANRYRWSESWAEKARTSRTSPSAASPMPSTSTARRPRHGPTGDDKRAPY